MRVSPHRYPPTPMTTPSFLARTTLGQPRYLLVAIACAFVIAMIPMAAWHALGGVQNNAEAWLPESYHEVQDLQWFREQFRGEQCAIVSWDGCTLGAPEKLELLAKKLLSAGRTQDASIGGDASPQHWYDRIITGPQVIAALMDAQLGETYAGAIERIQGALVGPPRRNAQGHALGNDSRPTCMAVYFSDVAMATPRTTRAAIDHIVHVAHTQCGIDPATIHMGGAPVDNAAIDAEGQRTLLRLAPLVAIVAVVLIYWRLGSARLTAIVLTIGAVAAGLSLALVYYAGAFEVLSLGRAAPWWGVLDALVLSMPAVVFLIAVSSALHFVQDYLKTRDEHGVEGAAERAARLSWRPTVVGTFAGAAAMLAFTTCDIVPIQKFGLFTALGFVAIPGVVFGVATVLLHRFPQSDAGLRQRTRRAVPGRLTSWIRSVCTPVMNRSAAALGVALTLLVVLGAGMFQLRPSINVLSLLRNDCDLVRDYAWLEQHIGNLVPMEVVLTIPPERVRAGDEPAESDGQQYRLTMIERLEMLREIERRLEAFPEISRATSVATFTPAAAATGLGSVQRSADYAKNKALEQHRDQLLETDYLRMERRSGSTQFSGRELWRLNARVASTSAAGQATDYAALLEQLKRSVEPVLVAYQQRDLIVRALHEQGKQLAGARVCVLFRAPNQAAAPPRDVQEHALAELLGRSNVAPHGVSYYNLAVFQNPQRGSESRDQQYRTSVLASLEKQDAVILASAPADPVARMISDAGVYIVDVTRSTTGAESIAAPLPDDGGPRPIRAVFTGAVPVVERTQREVIGSLAHITRLGAVCAAAVVVLGLMSVPAGVMAMVPALLPLVAAFGVMGWIGVRVDLGIAMTGGVALGLALHGGMHMVNWYRDGLTRGMTRRDAVMRALDGCGVPMVESSVIVAASTIVLGLSAFTPIREFGAVMTGLLVATTACNLLLLPAMLASPLGWFFAPIAVRRLDPLWPRIQASWEQLRPRRSSAPVERPTASPAAQPAGPHFVEGPTPATRSVVEMGAEQRRQIAEGPHAALHAKLQSLRGHRRGDSAAS